MSEESTRNSKELASFVDYCKAHPQERFWQALRNWCGWRFVFVANELPVLHEGAAIWRQHETQDTFYWEQTKPALALSAASHAREATSYPPAPRDYDGFVLDDSGFSPIGEPLE